MKQAWINKKEKERKAKISELSNKIRQELTAFGAYNADEIEVFIKHAELIANVGLSDLNFKMPYNNVALIKRWADDPELLTGTQELIKNLPYDELAYIMRQNYQRYLDTEPKHFNGDIIITDPCYVIKNDDWSNVCHHVNDLNYEPIPGAIMHDTIYGDWSCTTFDAKTKKSIGHFCADAGLVAIFDLAEVLKYNPSFDYHITKMWTTTLIKDFDGDVWFEIKHYNKPYGDDYSVHVVGRGVNTKTNEPFEFITRQTGF